MKNRFTLETAIIATKYAVAPIACWPLPIDASPLDILRRNIWWWFLVIHQIVGCIGWIWNIHENIHDFDIIIRAVAEMLSVMATVGKMIVCKAEMSRLQELLSEMQEFMKDATTEELEVIQFYVDKCKFSHSYFFVCSIFGPLPFIIGPIVTSSQPFPGNVSYPFSTESTAIWAILYISQSFLCIQVASMLILNFMYAILLWYTIARFHMLSNELQRATNDEDVTRCVQKHQRLLEYADKLRMSTRIIAVLMVAIAIIAVAVSGFVIIRRPPLYRMIEYVFYELCSATQLFIFTWPADNLIEMSLKVGVAAYTCDWVGKPSKILKKLLIIAQRSQISMDIAIRGVLPPLSLKFYGTTISTSFSYITTMRAMTRD